MLSDLSFLIFLFGYLHVITGEGYPNKGQTRVTFVPILTMCLYVVVVSCSLQTEMRDDTDQ